MDDNHVVDLPGMVSLLISGAQYNGLVARYVARALGRTLPYDHHAINNEIRWHRASVQVFYGDLLEERDPDEDADNEIFTQVELRWMSSEDRKDQ